MKAAHRLGICAVVVTYHPDDTVDQNVRAIARQCDSVFIVDNGSPSDTLEPIRRLAKAVANISLIINEENLGIAEALNIGIRHARAAASPQWIVTFDQDSTPTDGMIEVMLSAAKIESDRSLVAIIAPSHIDRSSGARLESGSLNSHQGLREVTSTLTSGNLVNVEALDRVGLFDTSFFIDYVDHEFCLRCRSHGYSIVEVESAKLLHSLGEFRSSKVLGMTINASHHNPLRRYYITRNRLIVWKKYLSSETRWVMRDVVSAIKETIKIIFVESDRRQKLKSIGEGIRDACRGRLGSKLQADQRHR